MPKHHVPNAERKLGAMVIQIGYIAACLPQVLQNLRKKCQDQTRKDHQNIEIMSHSTV